MIKKSIWMSILLVALFGVVIAGSTIAYFSDHEEMSDTRLVLGTVAIEALPASASTQTLEAPSISTGANWALKNIGTKDVLLRAKPITTWFPIVYSYNSETAWAVDASINNKNDISIISPQIDGSNSQGRYNIYTKNEDLVLKLGYGANYVDIGTVIFSDDELNMNVLINLKPEWQIIESHLYIGENPPADNAVGHLDNTGKQIGSSFSYSYPLPEGDFCYVALHSAVSTIESSALSNTAGIAPNHEVKVLTSGWILSSDGWYYYNQVVSPLEQVPFDVEILVLDANWEGNVELYNEGEAIQASNNSVEYLWPYSTGFGGSDE